MSKRRYPCDAKINCDQLAEYLGGYGLGQRKLHFNSIPVNTVKDWIRAGHLELTSAAFSTLQLWLDPCNYAEDHCRTLASDALAGFRLLFRPALPSPRKQPRYVEPEFNEYARRNESWTSRNELEPFQSGSFMSVHMAKYIDGPRLGEDCVMKVFKGKKVFDAAKFENEIRVTEKALEIITKFNRDPKILNPMHRPRKLRMLVSIPQVFTQICNLRDREKERSLVEPYIPNFEKMNSNTGWTARQLKEYTWFECTQALSHYSYHISDGQLG
jgi:Alpha-kinase family